MLPDCVNSICKSSTMAHTCAHAAAWPLMLGLPPRHHAAVQCYRCWLPRLAPGLHASMRQPQQRRGHEVIQRALEKQTIGSAGETGLAQMPLEQRQRLPQLQQQQHQQELTVHSVPAYVARHSHLTAVLGDTQHVQVEPLLDGVINSVFACHGPKGSLLLKQALPHVRAVGPSFPLSRERMQVEAAAMQLVHGLCPNSIPQLLLYDDQQSVMVVQYIGTPHIKLLDGIRQGHTYPQLAQQLASLLLCMMKYTCTEDMPPEQRAAFTAQFANVDMVKANEDVVLVHPFTPGHPSNSWVPELEPDVQALWADHALIKQAHAMLAVYRSDSTALIHNDLHAGNLLVTPHSVFVIDWEFATLGPVSYDLGCLFANLLLALFALDGMGSEDSRAMQRRWLLQLIQDIWDLFIAGSKQSHENTCKADSSTAGAAATARNRAWEAALLADTLGFAGCCIVRLIVGVHHYPDLHNIPDARLRALCERRCLELGTLLLKERHSFASMDAVMDTVAQLVPSL